MNKMKLAKMDIFLLQNAEFSQLMSRLVEDIDQSNFSESSDTDFNNLVTQLKEQIPNLNKALNQVRENEFTKKLALLDKIRQNDFTALRDSIKPYKNSKKEQQKHAYNTLKIVIDEYKNISVMNYEIETNKLYSLISTLGSEANKKAISILRVDEFVAELEESNKAFDKLFAQRSFQSIGKETYDTKLIRREMTATYRNLTKYTETLANIKQEEFYKNALEVINNSRKYFSDILMKRNGKKQRKKNIEEKKEE